MSNPQTAAQQLTLDLMGSGQAEKRPISGQADRLLSIMDVPGLKGIFGRISIAEQEIENFRQEYPTRSAEIWESFSELYPPKVMRNKSDRPYRSHCRELLGRVVKGHPVEEPTTAELICYFCEVSLAYPLGHNAAAAYCQLFKQLYPDSGIDMDIRPTWDGAINKLLNGVKDKVKKMRHE